LFDGLDANGSTFGLWVTDGTAAGTYELVGGFGGSGPSYLTLFHNEVLFGVFDGSGLWETDGTAAGTHELATMNVGGTATAMGQSAIAVLGNKALFCVQDPDGTFGLWVTNGTAKGTHELAVIGASASEGLYPANLTALNAKEVLFNGIDANGNRGLWVTDGTAAGTHELTGITGASSSGLNPQDITVFKGHAFFGGIDSNGNFGLGSRTVLISRSSSGSLNTVFVRFSYCAGRFSCRL
jgi:ELWxxDGT repeat protein